MTVILSIVVAVVVVVVAATSVAGAVCLAFRVTSKYTLTIFVILLVCLRLLWFVIRLYHSALRCLIRYKSINGRTTRLFMVMMTMMILVMMMMMILIVMLLVTMIMMQKK